MIIDFLKIYNDIISNENDSIILEETFANINKKDVKFSVKFSKYGDKYLPEDFKKDIKKEFDEIKPKNLKLLIDHFDKILEKYPLQETTNQQENTNGSKKSISITVKNTTVN